MENAQAQDDPQVACDLPAAEHVTTANSRDGIPDWAAWRSSDAAQKALGRLSVATDERFGDNEDWEALRRGYIGRTLNDVDHTVHLVVDMPASARAELQKAFQAIAGHEITLRVTQSCNTKEALLEAGHLLSSGVLLLGTEIEYFADLDPRSSTFDVAMYAQDAASRRSVATDLGALVSGVVNVVDVSGPPIEANSGSRVADSQPHWGGARIWNNRTEQACSSGFVVDTETEGKAMITAAHCGLVGDNFHSGQNIGYGEMKRRGPFPEKDMAVINSDTQNYDDDIFMNPIRAQDDPIDVSGSRVVDAGDHVCISGPSSLASCTLHVVAINGRWCSSTAGGCRENLIRYDLSEHACDLGDSGAPVFSRANDNPRTALITGIHIARGSQSAQLPDFGCLAHKVRTIESNFDVTVATSP